MDKYGQVHLLVINNSLLVPDIPYCVLSFQYLSQQSRDNRPIRRGTWRVTYYGTCKLQWKQHQFMRNFPWYPPTNVSKIQYTIGSVLHHVFVSTLDEALVTKAK